MTEIFLGISKKFSKKVLKELILLTYEFSPNLIIWGKFYKKNTINSNNYLEIIKNIDKINIDFSWSLEKKEYFLLESSDELDLINLELYYERIFRKVYLEFKKIYKMKLYVFLDNNEEDIKNIIKKIQEFFSTEDIIYQDNYSIEYKNFKFIFTYDEFKIELENNKNDVFLLKKLMDEFYNNNLIEDNDLNLFL